MGVIKEMNYRSIADLERCVFSNLHKIPKDVDLIVAIPRSGLLVATMVALHLNLPLTDLNGVITGRVFTGGRRLRNCKRKCDKLRRIAIIDDSVSSGKSIAEARRLLDANNINNTVYCAAYVANKNCNAVDVYFEVCPLPRVFEWNIMHHSILEESCVDMDGILCLDPDEKENDDGKRYLNFLRNAKPLIIPTVPIGAIVTCRLKKYRSETEEWLDRYGVKYRKLVMWDLPNKQKRIETGGHGQFKASVFRSFSWAEIFVESSPYQAEIIANYSRKPVICMGDGQIYYPATSQLISGLRKKIFDRVFKKRMKKYNELIYRWLLRKNRY